MAREHEWSYGHCSRCGHSTDMAGDDIETAPPCIPYDDDTAEKLVDAIGAALGVDTGTISEDRMAEAVAAAETALREATAD